MNVYNNDGCLVRWIVEDDAERVAAAKKDIDELGLEDVRVVPSARYSDVLSDRFVRVVIIGGLPELREERAREALSAGKNVLCERPIAFTLQSSKEIFELARNSETIFMPMLPGRPGKAFSAVVMSLFSSAELIECQRKLPDGFQAVQKEVDVGDKACIKLLTDMAMHDIFAVNFSVCMRPLSVTAKRIASDTHSLEVSVTYPNQCIYTVRGGLGQDHVDTQLFKLTGEALSSMRRVDHMHDDGPMSHAANTTFSETSGDRDLRMLSFQQEYDAARADALEQMYAMASGAKALASRVRPQLIENNLSDCLRIAQAALESLKSNAAVDIHYH